MIEARGLGRSFGQLRALDHVELTVARGAVYGVLGPSGAGKTTLIHLLALIAAPTTGTLRLFGEDAHGRPAALRARIGYMPQQAALYDDLSARANLEFFGRGAPPERLARLLALVALKERADDRVAGFSGGMKQRVSLACALMRDPELIFLDEPTAGIDPLLRRVFWEEFRRLAAAGKTIVVSTHQTDEAAHCDRLVVLREGRVLVEGTCPELLGRGGAVATARLTDGREVTRRLAHPARELPRLVEELGAATVAELDVRHDSLDEILVALIRSAEQPT
ncbi:MAG: ABC transporter ATP-binding protein [Myxococcales bacterium]|nr:ABC transporter ATP-binding protein [Myxococcales bacterium]